MYDLLCEAVELQVISVLDSRGCSQRENERSLRTRMRLLQRICNG